jgi:hypothetical protein
VFPLRLTSLSFQDRAQALPCGPLTAEFEGDLLVRKLALAVIAVTLALALPATASAATLAVSPVKSCYRSGERIGLTGTGFTPNSTVTIAVDGSTLGTAPTDPTGAIPAGGTLTVAQRSGEKVKNVTATDNANTANVGTIGLRVSAFTVGVRPRNGKPGARLRIAARGYLGRGTLRAHIVRGSSRRTVRVGRLKGACGSGTFRKRLFSRNTAPGVYRVQFDTRRRYSRSTREKITYRVRIFRIIRPAAAVAPTWTLLR